MEWLGTSPLRHWLRWLCGEGGPRQREVAILVSLSIAVAVSVASAGVYLGNLTQTARAQDRASADTALPDVMGSRCQDQSARSASRSPAVGLADQFNDGGGEVFR